MGQMIDGRWSSGPITADERGRFVRKASSFRGSVAAEEVSPGRFELIVAMACGWCHRALIWRALLGLEEAVPLRVVDPVMGERGWILPGG